MKSHDFENVKNILIKIDPEDITFDVNIKDEYKNYLLLYAIMLNQAEILKILLKFDINIDGRDKYGRSLLIIPIEYGYTDILYELLEYNKFNTGISLLDIKDKNLKTPLHYAIEIKNYRLIQLLLSYNANPNFCDINGYNSLHYAVKSRQENIVKLIITYISDINSRFNTGETSLHIACNLQLYGIIDILLENKINVNIQDIDNEISVLHYATILNNKKIINTLILHNANVNLQDIYGNTCAHYCVMYNNLEILELLVKDKNINLNMWNTESNLPLHIAFNNSDIKNINEYINILIDKTNVSFTDNYGNSCLYYLIKNKLWKKYKDVLATKRLDIFTKNKNNEILIELLDKSEKDEFIEMVVQSYLYRLKKSKKRWFIEWENICAKMTITDNQNNVLTEFETKNEKEIDTLKKQKIPEKINDQCKKIINLKIYDIIDKVKNNKKLLCSDTSFPMKNMIPCIDVGEGENIMYTTFTGSSIDILIGLIYLLKKHKHACSTINPDFMKQTELCGFYNSIGILNNSQCEFLNFEIIWTNQNLYLSDNFYENFKKALTKNISFIIIPIGINMKNGNHAGYLIYDKSTNEIERFEPHGKMSPTGLNYNANLLDSLLKSKIENIDVDIKYFSPSSFLPKIGFQIFDINDNKNKKIGDPDGFCALWAIWYTDMRLLYKDFSRKKLVKLLISISKNNKISFKNMIRNYSKNIVDIRDSIFKNFDFDINDWLNDKLTDTQINDFTLYIKKLISEL
jgi:ankyrin repeat protein